MWPFKKKAPAKPLARPTGSRSSQASSSHDILTPTLLWHTPSGAPSGPPDACPHDNNPHSTHCDHGASHDSGGSADSGCGCDGGSSGGGD